MISVRISLIVKRLYGGVSLCYPFFRTTSPDSFRSLNTIKDTRKLWSNIINHENFPDFATTALGTNCSDELDRCYKTYLVFPSAKTFLNHSFHQIAWTVRQQSDELLRLYMIQTLYSKSISIYDFNLFYSLIEVPRKRKLYLMTW